MSHTSSIIFEGTSFISALLLVVEFIKCCPPKIIEVKCIGLHNNRIIETKSKKYSSGRSIR